MERDVCIRQSMCIILCRTIPFLCYGACAVLGEYHAGGVLVPSEEGATGLSHKTSA